MDQPGRCWISLTADIICRHLWQRGSSRAAATERRRTACALLARGPVFGAPQGAVASLSRQGETKTAKLTEAPMGNAGAGCKNFY